jgi:hypothetical protein
MKSFAVTISAGVLFASTGLGATLGTYEFTSSSSEVPTVANGTFGAATLVGLNNLSSSGVLGLSGFTTGNSDLGQFVQFTIRPDAGYTLTINGFQWNSFRSSEGPTSAYLRLFAGTNPANNDPALNAAFYHPTESPTQITYNLGGSGRSSDDGLTLRIYGFSAGNPSGTLSFENLAVFGAITGSSIVVPEPATVSLALAGLALFGLKHVRRSR